MPPAYLKAPHNVAPKNLVLKKKRGKKGNCLLCYEQLSTYTQAIFKPHHFLIIGMQSSCYKNEAWWFKNLHTTVWPFSSIIQAVFNHERSSFREIMPDGAKRSFSNTSKYLHNCKYRGNVLWLETRYSLSNISKCMHDCKYQGNVIWLETRPSLSNGMVLARKTLWRKLA